MLAEDPAQARGLAPAQKPRLRALHLPVELLLLLRTGAGSPASSQGKVGCVLACVPCVPSARHTLAAAG